MTIVWTFIVSNSKEITIFKGSLCLSYVIHKLCSVRQGCEGATRTLMKGYGSRMLSLCYLKCSICWTKTVIQFYHIRKNWKNEYICKALDVSHFAVVKTTSVFRFTIESIILICCFFQHLFCFSFFRLVVIF